MEVERADRVGAAGLCPAKPERGKVWKPSQGFHQQQLARRGSTSDDTVIAGLRRQPAAGKKCGLALCTLCAALSACSNGAKGNRKPDASPDAAPITETGKAPVPDAALAADTGTPSAPDTAWSSDARPAPWPDSAVDATLAPTPDGAAPVDTTAAATPDGAPSIDGAAASNLDGSASFDTSDNCPIGGPINRYLLVCPTRVDLGFILPGATAPPQTLAVTVKADFAKLDISPPPPPADVTLASTCGQTMAAGTSCTVVVTVRATTIGTWRGLVLMIADNDPLSVLFTAQIQNPGQLVINPSNMQQFNAPAGSSSSVTFNIFNSGDTPMGPLTIGLSGDGMGAFTATGTGCDSIAKGAACVITVAFHASGSAGSIRNASLDVSTSTPYAQSVSVQLGGYVTSSN
jgi:hypothetical protein